MKSAYIKLGWFWFVLETTCSICPLIFDLKISRVLEIPMTWEIKTCIYFFKDSSPKHTNTSKLNFKNNKTLQQSHYRKLFGIILAFNLPLSVIKTYLPPILVSRDICEIQLIKSNKKLLKDRRCVLWLGYDNEKLKISQNRTIGTIWRECFNTKNLYKGSWRLL